jgi:hypothetical protein
MIVSYVSLFEEHWDECVQALLEKGKWAHELGEGTEKLALKGWQFFEYTDDFGMTLIDYALVSPNSRSATATMLDFIMGETVRISAICKYSYSCVAPPFDIVDYSRLPCLYSIYGCSSEEKEDLVRAAKAFSRLRNEAPFRAWTAFGLYGGSKIQELQNYLCFGTESIASRWLPAADHAGLLPTLSDYIAQKSPLSPEEMELLDTKGGFCFTWNPRVLFALLKNHVTFASEFACLGTPFAHNWRDEKCPIFSSTSLRLFYPELGPLTHLRRPHR